MTLIIAHGLAKSGSSFLFQVARDVAAAINGFPQNKAKRLYFSGMDVPDYVYQPPDELIESLVRLIPPSGAFVMKTHGRITPPIDSGIRSGSIKAIVSFRDPRDAVISMLDSGVRDRGIGKDRGFSSLYKVEDALRPVRTGWDAVRDWAYLPDALKVPYLLTATNQDFVIRLVCDYLSAGHAYYGIRERYAADKGAKITDFHKGVADRFLEDLTPEEIVKVSESLASEIAESDALNAYWMQAYGFRTLHQSLYEQRQTRLSGLIG